MTQELVFYTNPKSRGRIVRWMLEEVGAPYRTEVVEYGPAMKGPEFRAVNPMGKVPALKHGDQVVTETPAIITHLADAFPDKHLAPPSGARAAYYRWLFFAAGPLEQAIINGALGVKPSSDMQGMVGYGTMDAVLDTLEGVLSGQDFILGAKFSAVDVYLASELGFGFMFKTVEKRPVLEAYVRRATDRPARARALKLDGPM